MKNLVFFLSLLSVLQEPVVSEEVELIVESLLGGLLRTILEISNRPQPAGPSMRFQFQDVTVREHFLLVFVRLSLSLFLCVCVRHVRLKCAWALASPKLFGDLTRRTRGNYTFQIELLPPPPTL